MPALLVVIRGLGQDLQAYAIKSKDAEGGASKVCRDRDHSSCKSRTSGLRDSTPGASLRNDVILTVLQSHRMRGCFSRSS